MTESESNCRTKKEINMHIPNTPFTKIASEDPSRFILTHVQFDVENKVAVVTDGMRIVVLPVTPEEGDVTGIVPAEAVEEAQRLHKKKGRHLRNDPIALSNGNIKLENGATFERPAGEYPNWKQVVPRLAMLESKLEKTDEDRVAIESEANQMGGTSLNARLLYEMAQAMGTDHVTIRLPKHSENGVDNLSPILVTPGSGGVKGAFGVLMPMRMS